MDALYQEQRGLCVYCGRKLDVSVPGRTSHIEHFRPETGYPHLGLDYENLFLSCGLEDGEGGPAQACGNLKGSWFDEAGHVPPSYPSCTSRFEFTLNGEVRPAAPNDLAAQNMIDHLGLQHPELKKDREDFLFFLDAGDIHWDELFDVSTNLADNLAHIAYQNEGMILP